MKILQVADIHINLHKRKIPNQWQLDRFNLLFDKLLEKEKECDIVIIAGDTFDKKPQADEVALFIAYLHRITKPTYIIDGNHEATKKGSSFLSHFALDNVINNSNIKIITKNTNIEFNNQVFQFFPYCEMSIGKQPEHIKDSILVSHIRGEIPPHITEEYDFEKLRPWKLILLGDLHTYIEYKDYPAYYSGSPLNINFDRDSTRTYGINIINFDSINNYQVKFIELKLPKLIRKKVIDEQDMVKGETDHIIYEIEGSIDQLASIKNSELLDKKIIHKPKENSKIDLTKLNTLEEELLAYLQYIKIENIKEVMKEFNNVNQS